MVFNGIQWYTIGSFFVRVDIEPIAACLIHRVTRCRGYRGASVGLPNPTFWQGNVSSLKSDQITQSAGIRRFRLRRYVADQAAIRGVTGKHKLIIYAVLDGVPLVLQRPTPMLIRLSESYAFFVRHCPYRFLYLDIQVVCTAVIMGVVLNLCG